LRDEDKTKSKLIKENQELRKHLLELKKNYSELTEAASLTQLIFEKAPIGIWSMGMNGEILDVNEHGCKSLGYSKEELLEKTVFDIAPEFERSNWEEGISRLHEEGYRTIDDFHQHKDGEIIPIQVVEKLIQFMNKEYHIAFVQDISERMQREAEIREKDILLQDVETQAKIGGWKVDLKTGKVTNTDGIAKIYDLDSKENVNVEVGLSLYTEDSRKKIEAAFDEAVKKGTPYDLSLEIISAKGKHKWIHTTGYSTMEQGKIVSVQGSFQDISDIRQTEESLTLAHNIIEKANLGIYIISPEGKIIQANKYAIDLLGYTKEEFEKLSVSDIDPLVDTESWSIFLEYLKRYNVRVHEEEHRKKNGEMVPVEVHGYLLKHNHTQYIITFIQNITERKNTEKRMKELATTDELTKLMNRRSFFEQGHKEIQRNKRTGYPVSCIIFDIDYFKKVNDTYGHVAGDKVLKLLALNVKSELRNIDIFARIGGEEFAVILPETILAEAILVAERIRVKIENLIIQYDNDIDISVTVSLGVTQLKELETVEDILKRSDKALYEAKNSGRNRVIHL
jgi:diguanylate cyclase (GGDEF)-like protein/PAS domain S-box-containing protein